MAKEITKPAQTTDAAIIERIYVICGQKVTLDKDLAEMYGVEVRGLNQLVKRNASRFPEDFMFRLSKYEWENLKSQFVISSWGGSRKLPYAFTEQGVAVLSSVLRSERAHSGQYPNYPGLYQNAPDAH